MRHIEEHHSPYAPVQLFDLVVDVERYPEFMPWVIAAKVKRRKGNAIWTDLTMGIGLLCRQFTTVAVLEKPHRIEVNSYDPIFRRFEQIWRFEPGADGSTKVHYCVDLEIKSSILQTFIEKPFVDQAGAMVKAYLSRARHLYEMPRTLPRKEKQSWSGQAKAS
jgi:coenzyme Q-binding protein COQ10